MSFRFEVTETLPEAIRRVVTEEFDSADAGLSDASAKGWDDRVHEARKSMKKSRAVARLARPVLRARYAEVNGGCRDAAALLAPARDAAVLAETATALLDRYSAQINVDRYAALVAELQRQAAASRRRVPPGGRLAAEAAARIRALREDVREWPLESMRTAELAAGLSGVLRRGGRGFDDAYSTQTTEAFHEWRKGVKYLWYHVRLLVDAWPTLLGALADELDVLSEHLGDEHDLTVLAERVNGTPDAPPLPLEAGDREVLLALLAARQAELRALARPIGRRVYAESAKACAMRLAAYWEVAST